MFSKSVVSVNLSTVGGPYPMMHRTGRKALHSPLLLDVRVKWEGSPIPSQEVPSKKDWSGRKSPRSRLDEGPSPLPKLDRGSPYPHTGGTGIGVGAWLVCL